MHINSKIKNYYTPHMCSSVLVYRLKMIPDDEHRIGCIILYVCCMCASYKSSLLLLLLFHHSNQNKLQKKYIYSI